MHGFTDWHSLHIQILITLESVWICPVQWHITHFYWFTTELHQFDSVFLFFQNLKAEFDQHEELLSDLEKQAEQFKAQGRSDAAERLEQQILLLKVGALGGEIMASYKEWKLNWGCGLKLKPCINYHVIAAVLKYQNKMELVFSLLYNQTEIIVIL